ncbi:hypothetical protein NDU88_006945 [Pleurodeles waltl]|uniref:Uncharacterized protein n=1 Tax=Pleurodeles waltl TaxID=8319 RepID=A0AAV7PPZ1_PLEWA|nr:hypothetical protein NDU88_006945 [Pleurodeles waltl]
MCCQRPGGGETDNGMCVAQSVDLVGLGYTLQLCSPDQSRAEAQTKIGQGPWRTGEPKIIQNETHLQGPRKQARQGTRNPSRYREPKRETDKKALPLKEGHTVPKCIGSFVLHTTKLIGGTTDFGLCNRCYE